MKLSYWEYKSWLSNVDFTVVGSGIVGLSCALALREKFPSSKILILEKGILPQGASTKNAGFACYGSISEILADLDSHSEEEVVDLVKMRWEGIGVLRGILGDAAIRFEQNGGHELFLAEHSEKFEYCMSNLERINELLEPVFHQPAFVKTTNRFGFKNILEHYISNPLEGQLDTGMMMQSLLNRAWTGGINILNSVSVSDYEQLEDQVEVVTDQFQFKTKKLFIATNGFAAQLLDEEVTPARAQVLTTKPIQDLKIRGTFHIDEGYYYFRNIDGRILLGGGRNLDFEGETTSQFGTTQKIQSRLEEILADIILPDTSFEIDRRWSGIMGRGTQKLPVLKPLSNDVYCGVRLGGMGIAIGSLIGKSLADFTE